MSLISVRAFAAPTATVTLRSSNPLPALIDTDVTFCVRFENTGNAVGFGPFLDLLIDHAGGGPPCDGLSYVSAKLVHTNPSLQLNAVATPQVAPCGSTMTFSHPWGFPPTPASGQEFVRIELPFGSMQNGQAALDVEITVHVHPQADVGTSPLIVQVRGGYRWGGTFFSNWIPQTVVPEVVIIGKKLIGLENEIVSGPNFPGQYQIDIDVAPGQTIMNAVLQDCAPNGVVFQSSGSNCFTQQWSPLPAGHQTILAPFHVLEPPAILPACSRTLRNRARLISGVWTPAPPSTPPDPPINFSAITNKPTGEVTIEERILAIEKRVTSGAPPVPGGTLGYQLDFRLSDYHRVGQVVVTDTLSDGQTLSGLVNVSVRDRFGSKNVSLPVPSSCITTLKNFQEKYVCPPGKKEPCSASGSPTIVGMTGGTRLTIDVSCIMKSTPNNPFNNGVLTGGEVPTSGGIAATGTITFNVTINDQFSYPHLPGDPFVDKHDPVLNAASITGVLASNANVKNPALTGPTCVDSTYSCLSVPGDTLTKIVYAKNQIILNPPVTPVGNPLPQFSVGDTITYQLSKMIPTGDAEEVTITDWFVLPLVQVPPLPPLTQLLPCVGSPVVPPTANAVACYVAPSWVPTHTMAPFPPNAIKFDFGTFNNTANTPVLFEIYVTLTISNDPRPDGLHQTNHAEECEKNTFGVIFCQTAIAQFELTEPLLRIGKGVICPDPVCPPGDMTETARVSGRGRFADRPQPSTETEVEVLSHQRLPEVHRNDRRHFDAAARQHHHERRRERRGRVRGDRRKPRQRSVRRAWREDR